MITSVGLTGIRSKSEPKIFAALVGAGKCESSDHAGSGHCRLPAPYI
jgi:hypothetical protein